MDKNKNIDQEGNSDSDSSYSFDDFQTQDGNNNTNNIKSEQSEKLRLKHERQLNAIKERLAKKYSKQKQQISNEELTKLAQEELVTKDNKKKERKEKSHKKHLDNLKELKSRKSYFNEEDNLREIQNYYKDLFPESNKGFNKNDFIKSKINYENLNKLTFSNFKKARRREYIFSTVERREDFTLRCIYTDELIENENGERFTKVDEEHSLPQSYQSGSGKGTGRDMHQIFAAEKSANGQRGNLPFGVVDFVKKTKNNYSELIKEDKYGAKYNNYLENGNSTKSYIPKCNKGIVCRSTLYVLVCYSEALNSEVFPMEFLDWIIYNAKNEPISIFEKHRNSELFKLQKNRNPFIDFPEWIDLVDFKKGFFK